MEVSLVELGAQLLLRVATMPAEFSGESSSNGLLSSAVRVRVQYASRACCDAASTLGKRSLALAPPPPSRASSCCRQFHSSV